jgi:hypothetical protein
MTLPFERTGALVQAKEFLAAMMDPKLTPRTPRWMRGKAKAIVRHHPGLAEIEKTHKAQPHEFWSVPPFLRLSGSVLTNGAIDSTKTAMQQVT